MTRTMMEEYFETKLEDEYLEDILEKYDLEPLEVLMVLWEKGLIDDSIAAEDIRSSDEY